MLSLVKIQKLAELARAGPTTPEPSDPSFESIGQSDGLSGIRSQSLLQALVSVDEVFSVGQLVQAWSRTEQLWLPAEILDVDPADGMVKIKPAPVLEGAKPWVHPRGHTPYVDGYDRSSVRPMPKDSDAEEVDKRVPLSAQWSFHTNFEDIKATKSNDERGWAKVRRIFAPDVILPGMKNEHMSPENILEHMFGLKYGPFVKKEPPTRTPGQRRSKQIIARAQANRQRSIERRL